MTPRTLAPLVGLLALCAVTGRAAEPVVALTGSVRVAGQAAANAVIWLEGGTAASRARKAVLHQRSLRFIPQVLAVQTGTVVDFPNEDRVFHNVFSFRDGKKFDLGIYPVGTTKQVTFTEPGVSRLLCNIHPNMAGYVVAVDSAWFATSDAGGRFEITGVEPGTYTWHAWRAAAPVLEGSVTVRAGTVLEVVWP